MSGDAAASTFDELFWREEVLEAMYWMVGEGIEDAVGPDDLRGFLDAPPGALDQVFGTLEDRDLVAETADGFVFTERGEHEAARRFEAEFAEIQGFESGHNECDADCWCHDPDHAAEECPSDHDHEHHH